MPRGSCARPRKKHGAARDSGARLPYHLKIATQDEGQKMAENTHEKIAFDLMDKIANTEGKIFAGSDTNVDRTWILRTYAQCLETVRNPNLVHEFLDAFTG